MSLEVSDVFSALKGIDLRRQQIAEDYPIPTAENFKPIMNKFQALEAYRKAILSHQGFEYQTMDDSILVPIEEDLL